MPYPTIQQYIDALRLAEENFDQLTAFRLVTNADGQPVMSGGNFAEVFKMQDTRDGSFHALKCFLKDQPGRAEAYRAIADELEQVVSPYLIRIQYLEGELFVGTSSGGVEYPVLVMDWVEGLTLDNYLRAHLSDPYALHLLAYQFGRLAAWLLTQPFAHGDLKPDNILVRPDGTLVLVDYDGMFVPAMQGQRAPEMGSPDFRHPDRTDADFSEHIDDFALASILLSLRAVAHCPDYLSRYGAADRLLLSEADYRSPECCAFLRQEFPSTSAELDRVYALFLLALRQKTLAQVSFRLFNLAKPAVPPPPVVVNTAEATDDEIANGIEDEFGVVYSPDGTELLRCTDYELESYQVKEGCKVIRGSAFYSDILSPSSLTAITLPTGLTHIGDGAFAWCVNLTAITLPATLTHIGNSAFSFCMNLTAIILPASLTHIGYSAFMCCKNLTAITLPASLTHIGHGAFGGCSNLTAIALPAGLTHIGDRAFNGCENLAAITLPATLTHIGDGAFLRTGIRSVVNSSPHFAFQDGCLIDVQGKRMIAFLSDKAEVTLPDGLTHIGDMAFLDCKNLTAITLPATLTHIGDGAIAWCVNLTAITLPATLTHIGDRAFEWCANLTAITLPATLTHIGDDAFEWCVNLTAIHIPKGMKEHFKALLPSDLHSKLKELEALPKSPEYPLYKLNLQDLENFLNASVKPKLFEPVNALPGPFTINANGTKVRFSMGNLQYQAATRTWHFAEHQWEWVGDANSFTNNGWIDLFEFGSGYNPMSASYYYYHNRNFCDWGENTISNGGNTPNIWRTLTADEWKYLLKTRAGASAKMATGNIDGVHGLILLPDSWTQPSGCSFNAGFADEENDWTHNTYTLAQWTMMENAGAVFLPAAGKLLSGSVIHVGEFGSYWSSTPHHDYEASSVKFWGDSALVMSSDSYDDGLSVRVVIEVSKL